MTLLESVFKTKLIAGGGEQGFFSTGGIISTSQEIADALKSFGIEIPGFDAFSHSFDYEELHARFHKQFEPLQQAIQYDRPQRPLDVEVADATSGLGVPNEYMELLLSCAKWEIEPPFVLSGRSAWAISLHTLLSSDPSEMTLRAFKLKGVGSYDKGIASPPRNSEFFHGERLMGEGIGRLHVLIHMGVKEDGSFYPVVDPSKPVGGMTFKRAKAEFENAKQLLAHRSPAVRPVAYGKYKNLFWEGEPMGFVMLASSIRNPYRIGEFFEPIRDDRGLVLRMNPVLASMIETRFDILTSGHVEIPMLKCVRELAEACGMTLRSFHEAGLCRFAGHTGNFQYDLEKRIALQHDLDSAVQITSLASKAQGLSLLRDLESGLFGLWHSLFHAEIYKVRDQRAFEVSCNPFTAWLRGYFGQDMDGKLLAITGMLIMRKMMTAIRFMPAHGGLEWMGWFNDFAMSFTEDVMELLMPIFGDSSLGKSYPLPYGPGPISREHFARFRQERDRIGSEIMEKRLLQMNR